MTDATACIHFLDLVRNLNIAFGSDFLFDQRHGKEWGQVFRANRLFGAGMERRWQFDAGRGQIGIDIVPMGRHIALSKHDFREITHQWALQIDLS